MDARRLRRGAVWLGALGAVGMFGVVLMGVTVTTTGSAQGCGRDWPLCHGRFIPDFALSSTATEFSHRAVTGAETVLIVALAAAALAFWRRQPAVRVLAPLMLATLFLQAGLGAWAVKYPQQPLVLALHFGISLVALASTVLMALSMWEAERLPARPPAPVAGALRLATWGTAAYVYGLVYSGAYIRHAAAAAACASWPVCPAGAGSAAKVAVNLVHRGAAALALVIALMLLVAFIRLAANRGDLAAGAWFLIASLVAQGLSGAYLVRSGFGLTGELLHAALTGITFTAIAYLCLRVSLGPDRATLREAVVDLRAPRSSLQ